ncbi:MAG TPA: FUSC family protein [Terracidiphilus sp.]
MASAVHLVHKQNFSEWFPEFLRQELAPYPGRGAVVSRMVIAATLSMIIIVTYRIPGGAIGALCAFILSRESFLSTARSALYIILAFAIGGLFIPIGARLFAADPITHFLWEGASLFMIFFLLKTLNTFALATGLALVATNILSIWYLPGPAERNVELTLWQVLAALIGAAVTVAVEAVFRFFSNSDELHDGLRDRLKTIEEMLLSYAGGEPIAKEISRALTQYAVVGMGALRRYVARTNYDPLRRVQMSTLVSLTGRSIDMAAALVSSVPTFEAEDQQRAARLAPRIAEIWNCFSIQCVPNAWEPTVDPTLSTPLLSELESMVAYMFAAARSDESIDPRLEILEEPPSSNRIFTEDAFTNPEHLRFALSGTLAAMLCYILYVGLAWPDISTSVTTCVLTALSNIGASRQKQVLRLAGALVGGVVFGLGSQLFVLPYLDSITGFTVLFAVVSACAAYVSTSSSRLSYAGLQIALAFYLINLSEFRIQLSLTVARDRAVGVLLGVCMMWLVFERVYPRAAADEMVRVFIRTVRLMASFVSESGIGADAETIILIRRQRDQVYRFFGEVNAQADAVPFETGPQRAGHMAARDRIRRWQASLRTFYLMEIPLLQFRLFSDPKQISEAFRNIEKQFLGDCSSALNRIADTLESQLQHNVHHQPAHTSLQNLLAACEGKEHTPISPQEEGLLRLNRTISGMIDKLEEEAVSVPIFAEN